MRRIIALLAVSVLAAACAQPNSESERISFAYSLDAGDSFSYDHEYAMTMVTEIEGVPMEDVPQGPIDLDLTAAVTTHYAVAEGTDPDTYVVTLTYDHVSDLEMTMSAGGEEMTFTEADVAGELAGSGFPLPGSAVEFTVDSTGHILGLTVDGSEMPLPGLGGGGGGFGGFGAQTPFLGPELPQGSVAVGDTWSSRWTVEPFPGASMEMSAVSTLARAETVDGVEVYVIETTATSTPLDVDLASLLGGFTGEPSGIPDDFGLSMTLTPVPSRSTSWFDPARGITVRQEFSGGGDMTMSFRGEGQSGSMTMHTEMEGSLQLAG